MKKEIPSSAVTIRTFDEMFAFAKRFARGDFNLLAIVGTAGLSKSQTFRSAMKSVDHCLIKGNATAFIFYKTLYDNCDLPVVLDDADTLYADRKCRPLMKGLCDTDDIKVVSWHSKAIDDDDYPRSFQTRSRVAILCNEWHGMKEIVDRGHFLSFVPTVWEVHRQVAEGGWFRDDEVFRFIEDHLHLVSIPSMRYYTKGAELKNSGLPNWRDLVLNMLNPDLDMRAVEVVSKLMADDDLTEKKKEAAFSRLTKMSRATYYRYKKVLADAR